MRLPVGWLRELVDPDLSPEELAERLSTTGTWVERIERHGLREENGNLDAFRVGRVLEAGPHPDADRLRLCRVDVGEPEARQIVCGAPNVAAGQTVPVALPGALLPGAERPLGTARLRGVESRGMILSERELALGADSDGIMVLDADAAPGTPLARVLPLVEVVLDIDLTSNRPDLLGVWGLAREVHAVTGAPLRPLDESEPPAEGPGRIDDHARVRVEATDLCPRFTARVLTDVRIVPSPLWLRARLEAAGMRSINNVVDVTNYVMLLTGQPLHAFDLDRLHDATIVVRRAREGEAITTLDGQRRALSAAMLAICDARGPVGIAGTMGAEEPEVHRDTTRVLLEAASFDGPTTYNASVALGLRTEASGRFEKGLPPQLPPRASVIASRMMVELCGARLVPGMIDVCEPLPEPPRLRLRHARVDAVLGAHIDPAESATTLERLGCGVTARADAHEVAVPFERARDLTREIDLVEEVARIHGLERIPAELPRMVGHGRRSAAQRLRERLARRAADLGLSEAITYRFVPEGDADLLRLDADDPRRHVVRLTNPVSEDMAVMRRSMLPGLLRAVAHNQAHQRRDGGLFEIGRTYAPREDGLADEREWLAGVVFGDHGPAGWRSTPRSVDVFVAIGLAEALARAGGVTLEPEPNSAPYFHPVRQVRLRAGETTVAWAGELHPLVLRGFDVAEPAAALVIDLAALEGAAPTSPVLFEDLVSVPVSRRDLAVVVPDDVPAAELVARARAAGAPLVREVSVFDRYSGAQVPEGQVSLALRLVIADPGRTLTEEEIEAQVAAVEAALAERGARRRA